MRNTPKKGLILAGIALAISAHSNAETFSTTSLENMPEKITQNNGYTQIVIDTEHEQKYPLDTVVTLSFPADVKNVGQSLNYMLQNSGYHLKELSSTDPETLHLYTLETPLSQRSYYEATVLQILQTLAGQAYELEVDHIQREVSIKPLTHKASEVQVANAVQKSPRA
ncbi:hypothetical protein HUO09_17505 [Vibrio sp. Y2-5]|uniref:PFGI-1 class ICE element type IV pilus protein PilL2 n=1 Tax=Vibrio sp. Y2-5 TaxID=2743977 RepID=UPI001660EDFA|nr:hypothetical protein [Vibrio sp. Y2-5]MBD0788154.1 hypothetical protein [Vibrio sp. Y2-5]